jgi:hypothetical protein
MKSFRFLQTSFLLIFLLLVFGSETYGQKVKVQGIVSQGGQVVVTAGSSSTTKVIKSFPSVSVTVFATGTTNLISIWSDYAGSIVKANPFTSSSDASFFFYATSGQRVDVRFGAPSPFTLSDMAITGAIDTSLFLLKTNNLSDLSNASTARTNLGATTVGGNIFTATNPSAISFPRVAADNSILFRSASAFLSDINGANTTLSNLGTTAVNADILPGTTGTRALGSYSKEFLAVVTNKLQAGNTSNLDAAVSPPPITLQVWNNSSNAGTDNGDWLAWFRHEGTAINNESLIRHQHFSLTYVPQPIFAFMAARGTVASPVGLINSDHIGIIDGRGFDGSAVATAEYAPGWSDTSAQMDFQAAGTWSGTSHPSRIIFRTTASASITPVERIRITQSGNVGIGDFSGGDPGSILGILGTTTIYGAGSHVNSDSANNDRSGLVNISSSTSVIKTFSGAYNSNPVCVVTPVQDMGAVRYWVTNATTTLTVTVSASGTYQFNYACYGNPF